MLRASKPAADRLEACPTLSLKEFATCLHALDRPKTKFEQSEFRMIGREQFGLACQLSTRLLQECIQAGVDVRLINLMALF